MVGKFELFQFNGRGKQIASLEGVSSAMLNMWALNNTSGKKLSIVRNAETEEIVCVVEGNGKDFPKATTDRAEIDEMCIELEVI